MGGNVKDVQEEIEGNHNLLPELTKDATVVILTKETKEDYRPGKVIIPEPTITLVLDEERNN